MIRSFAFAVSVFSLLFAALPASRASQNLHIQTTDNPRVEVTLESFLDESPPSGFAPMLVTLRNRTDAPQTFRLNYTVGNDRYSDTQRTFSGGATIQVEARGRNQTYVYVPIPGQTSWDGVRLNLTGPDIRDGSVQVSSHNSDNAGAFIGMTDSLAAKHWSAIENELKKISSAGGSRNEQIKGTKFSPAGAPPDWRAYSGFTSLWMTAGEWNDLDPGARAAICEWIGFGGKLVLIAKNQAQRDAALIPGAVRESAGERSLGLGKILFHSDEDGEKFIARFIRTTKDEINPVYLLQRESRSYRYSGSGSSPYSQSWGLADIVGTLSRNILPLSIFMILFAVAIGPVNFFVLAPSKRRYRILWTTPLIALGASALLAVFILLSDGVGGTGARLTFACLLPEQKRLLVQQEQISKTGLLLGSSFDFDAGTQLMPIDFSGSRDSGSFTQTATGWSGDWFASRALRGQYARTVRSARGGVHVTLPADGSAGNVIVALDMPLKEFFVLSPTGTSAYKAENLVPGVRTKLVKVNISELHEAWKKMCEPAGDVIKKGTEICAMRSGWFYAVAKNPGENASETLRSINWKTDIGLVAGPAKFEEAK